VHSLLSKRCVICKQPLQWSVTTLQQSALSMTLSDNADPKPWTCAFTGSRTAKSKDNFIYIGHLEAQIGVTISPNTAHSPAHHRIMRPRYIHTPTAQELKHKQLHRGRQKYIVASLIGEIRGLLQGLGEGVLILPQDPGYQDPASHESASTQTGPGSKSGRHSFLS
jgi:hypothetical protein